MLRQNSIQKIIQNNFCMVNSIQNSIQNFEISRIQFNKIFIQFENVGIDHGYRGPKNVMPDWFCFLNFFSYITVLSKKCGGNTFLEG